ncbi:DUF3306 domain-containing protein (plasmid) [Diaphorobacter sp. HDW4B]|uniref:DUF3306 domain-containing protein n=1 Tax=Diaphorobacter sp. HDW4B TaxID=2714925 RepID=UPI00140B68CD|nr:DUF3306 domain-containing protein [Diaphorobacter sp. HDW4B]QIL74294.1 DUF3306 domain-containing protein [Diaphorobacter sp. HDW4B]
MADNDGFLSRWSRRKVQAKQNDAPLDEPAQPVPAVVSPAPDMPIDKALPDAAEQPPLPTLDDVAALGRDSDFTRFVTPEVSGEVRNAALKKLFSDPHFNVMDGLDTYIDDYNKPDPLPAAMLKKMAQAAYLGLVEPEVETDDKKNPPECAADNVSAAISPAANTANDPDAAAMKVHDEDPDLRLQSHHDPGPPGAGPGLDGNAQRQR